MVRRGDARNMNRLVLEAFSHVEVDGGSFAVLLLDRVGALVSDDFIDIDDGRDFAVLAFAEAINVRAASPVDADHRHSQDLGRTGSLIVGGKGRAGPTGESRRGGAGNATADATNDEDI